MLVEFASVVDAVCCAVDIQREMAEHNSAIPAERRIELRMGINVGDIIIDEGDIYGDASMSRHGWRGWPVQREAPLLHLACAAAGRVRLPTRRADLGHQAVQRLCFAVEHRRGFSPRSTMSRNSWCTMPRCGRGLPLRRHA